MSLEPVINPAWSLEIIRQTHEFVDHYKAGTLNHSPPVIPTDLSAEASAKAEVEGSISNVIANENPHRRFSTKSAGGF